MTNEEKAIELQRNDVCVIWNNGCPNVREAALKMAEWKDRQFKDIKADAKKELAYEIREKIHNGASLIDLDIFVHNICKL